MKITKRLIDELVLQSKIFMNIILDDPDDDNEEFKERIEDFFTFLYEKTTEGKNIQTSIVDHQNKICELREKLKITLG